MVTPEEAREIAESIKDRRDWYEFEPAARCPRASNALLDLANQVERLEAQKKQLREALACMVVAQEREGFGDEMFDIKNARAALKDTE